MAIFLTIALAFLQVSPEISTLLQSADKLFENGKYQDAEDIYIRALSLDPQLFAGMIGLAKTRVALGDPQSALKVLNGALNRRPDDRTAKRVLAQTLVTMNVLTRAEPLLRELTEADSTDRESFFYLGTLMYQNGYYGAALSSFDKSLPDENASTLRKIKTDVYRAVCLSRVGRTADAEAALSQLALQADARKEPDLLLVYAELLYETGRPELALKQADQALVENSSIPMAHFWRAKVLLHLNRLPEAAQAAERSIALLPQLPYAHSLLLRIYQSQGKSSEASREAEWLRNFEQRFINGPGGPGGPGGQDAQ